MVFLVTTPVIILTTLVAAAVGIAIRSGRTHTPGGHGHHA